MNLIYEKHTPFTFTITLSTDRVLDIILAESAWRAKHAPFVFLLTAEHRAMLEGRIGTAVADLLQRLGNYVEASNWNPALADENLVIVLGLGHDPGAAFGESLPARPRRGRPACTGACHLVAGAPRLMPPLPTVYSFRSVVQRVA